MSIRQFVQDMFPKGTISYCTGLGHFEVNGLEENTLPEGVTILNQGREKVRSNDRTFYLVENEQYIAYLRVCKAMPGSEYAEFAVGHGIALKDSKDADVLRERAIDYINLISL